MKRQRGSATVFGIIMILLLTSMGATLLMLCTTHLQIATNHRDGIAAQYWAEAGIEDVVAKLKTNTDFVNQTQVGNQLITANFPSSSASTGNYIVQTGPDPKSIATNVRVVIATGTINKTQRQIIAHITLPKPGDELKKNIIIRKFREGEYFGT